MYVEAVASDRLAEVSGKLGIGTRVVQSWVSLFGWRDNFEDMDIYRNPLYYEDRVQLF